jgi:DNA-binding MarR family transcriptional regulator
MKGNRVSWLQHNPPTRWSASSATRSSRWFVVTVPIYRPVSLATCYLQDGAHTVRGLAADLNVSKPAITRALDRLGELDLARRKVDPMDRRSVLVQRTLKGAAFLRDLRGIMTEATAASRKGGSSSSEERRSRAHG